MDSHNNTGYTSLKIFCESRMASVHLSNTRKIWTLNKPIVVPTGHDIQMLCSVESASIPLSYYTINKTNNRFMFNNISGEVAFGNYNAYELAEEITKIAPFTVTFCRNWSNSGPDSQLEYFTESYEVNLQIAVINVENIYTSPSNISSRFVVCI